MKVCKWYLGFGTLFSDFFFPRAFGGAGINSSEDGTGRSTEDSTFAVSGLPLPWHFFCFVGTSDKSRGLAACREHEKSAKNQIRLRDCNCYDTQKQMIHRNNITTRFVQMHVKILLEIYTDANISFILHHINTLINNWQKTLSSASMLDVSVVVDDVSSLSASFSFSINFSFSRRISPAFSFLIFPCLLLTLPLLLLPNATAAQTQLLRLIHFICSSITTQN